MLKRLESYLDDSITVSDIKILRIAKDAVIRNEEVIRSTKNPINKEGGLKILSGSLAPDGGHYPSEIFRDT